MMKIYTWKQAIALFAETSKAKAQPNLTKNLKTALNKHVRLGLDPNALPLRPTEFDDYCAAATVDTLNNALTLFDQVIDAAIIAGQLSPHTKRTYRSPLSQFLEWMHEEVWFQEQFPEPVDTPMPRYRGVRHQPSRGARSPYALKEEQLPIGTADCPGVAEQLQQLESFWTKKGREAKRKRRGAGPIRQSTYEKTKKFPILCFFGWLVKIKGFDPNNLCLELLLDLALVEQFIDWLVDERDCNHSAGHIFVQTAISVAKFLHSHQLASTTERRRRNWSDVPIIEDLRDIDYECQQEYKIEKKQNEEEKWARKEISHRQAREVVQYLNKYRSLCYANLRGRHPSAIWWDWQRYLGVKLLVFGPVRQEELRKLEKDKTLFRKTDANGNPYYEVRDSPDLHKLGSRTNKSRHYRLPDILTQDLDDWFNIWRPQLVEALQSVDAWLAFWGHPPGEMERLKARCKFQN